MRGRDDRSEGLFTYVRLEERIPADHPLRPIRLLTDEVLGALSKRFEGLYSSMGRPSIAPEVLLRATLLQAFFSVRSERMLWSRSTTIFCSGGSSACRWMRRSGTRRCSPTTATGCLR